MAPRVSILLPYRDAGETLAEALGSLLAQRGAAFEVLAVDDGSADGGARIVERLARTDRRITPLSTAPGHRGIVSALTLGADQARGELLGRMDADDVCLPGRLEAQVRALDADRSLGVVGTRAEAFPAELVGEGLARYVAWQNSLVTPGEHARDLFVESPLCHPSVLMRRDAFAQVGGYREVEWWEDYDLWLRLWAAGWSLAKVPAVLLRWRHSNGRMTLTHPRADPERTRECKAHYLAPWLRARGRPVTVWGAGQTGRRMARTLEAHDVRARRFVDIDPRKIGRTARGAPIVAPDALEQGAETVVVAVGSRGARGLIRADLDARGFTELDDYVCTA